MKKKRVKVYVLGRDKLNYKIKFSYLNIPVIVNKYIYDKMLKSSEYQFLGKVL